MKNCTWQLSGNRQERNTSLKAMNKVLSHTLRISDLMAEHSEQCQKEHKELVEALHQLSQVIGVQGPAVGVGKIPRQEPVRRRLQCMGLRDMQHCQHKHWWTVNDMARRKKSPEFRMSSTYDRYILIYFTIG